MGSVKEVHAQRKKWIVEARPPSKDPAPALFQVGRLLFPFHNGCLSDRIFSGRGPLGVTPGRPDWGDGFCTPSPESLATRRKCFQPFVANEKASRPEIPVATRLSRIPVIDPMPCRRFGTNKATRSHST